MFHGLGLDPLVRPDTQEEIINAADAGQEVFQEAFMPRNVNEPQLNVGRPEMGEAQINGDFARLLLGEAIAVNPRERLQQSGFAVVHVSGRADDGF